MAKIVLISCSKSKLDHRAKAIDMYTGALFRLSLQYAKTLKLDKLFILSAKHHLLDPNREIEPYDLSLKLMSKAEKAEWANIVIGQLREHADLENDTFVMLAGSEYAKPLESHVHIKEYPLAGLSLGNRLKRLKALAAESDRHG
ncbi:hypothetical protein M1329_01980 [Candidatus Marsarchaeota archaeon]|jgi:cytoplasmic iron level regulating protein YaaA (DUF328/UPF0246 family)|nr:hypothetical protein [Candidatus Marsarchaeota archaeon]MCL5099571.1 hypothetical protein [Candidatus Marsarchaeota archaeon]